ncbi:Uncharacterised protein [Mycobacteroides abscessus subsp. abscessus]|nr:Uncharacterised protein [Mycobacteroides abscessus subsp. abscessus]
MPAASTFSIRVPGRNSTRWSRYQSVSWTVNSDRSCLPCMNSFDNGGRSYGSSFSTPKITTSPSKSCSRSASAAFAPASPPPTIAIVVTAQTFRLGKRIPSWCSYSDSTPTLRVDPAHAGQTAHDDHETITADLSDWRSTQALVRQYLPTSYYQMITTRCRLNRDS